MNQVVLGSNPVDNLVVLQEKNIPPSHWPLSRFTEIYLDRDGVVRIVKLRTPYLMEGSND